MQHLFKNWLKLIYLTLLLHKVLFYMIGKPNTFCLLDKQPLDSRSRPTFLLELRNVWK